VKAFAAAVGDVAVDVLINNAGVKGKRQPLAELDFEDAIRTIDTNALGAVRVTRALLPNLFRGEGKRVAHISSGLGSIADNTTGDAYAYRMSKAALNMASRSMAVDLRGEGIISVVLNPGWVKTDMGGPSAPTEVEESVRRMLGIINGLTLEQSGSFIDYRGHTIGF
jgi:NAD(P)-dependent dehydrogenase (short-subunit alcohol dehydrogenase family)